MSKNVLLLVIFPALILGLVFFVFFYGQIKSEPVANDESRDEGATNYQECVAEGNPRIMIFPGQCTANNGKVFVQDVGNTLEKADMIMVYSPQPEQKVTSPLTIEGRARGTWFFEASFPVTIEDSNGNTLITVVAQAVDEWMTEDFVSFTTTATFSTPTTQKGKIIFRKDNPSGLPENEDSLFFPITFY